MLQNVIRNWLRSVASDKASQAILDRAAILATDVGVKRKENQDRVAALHVETASPGLGPFICFALSDGMGGMSDGGECATLTIAALFSSLIQTGTKDATQRLTQAAHHANNAVNEFAKGRGGATLSAVLIERDRTPCFVNVGDSRIYTTESARSGVYRATIDDTLSDAFGGIGNELVQYIGMGGPLVPKVDRLAPNVDGVLLTSDGAHFFEAKLFEKIVENAQDPVRATERLIALSRWLGGPDNASVLGFRVPEMSSPLLSSTRGPATIWSGASELQIALVSEPPSRSVPGSPSSPLQKEELANTSKSRNKRKSKKHRKSTEPNQLEITISSDHNDDASDS